MKFLILFFTLCVLGISVAQEFENKELNSINDLRAQLNDHFEISEVHSVQPLDSSGIVHIHNGLRSSSFVNTEKWLEIKDGVEVDRIDIVFSKYPIRNGVYSMYYPLLQRRLNNLFKIDAGLNSELIQWHIVLQTNCHSDDEADALFHGVRIHYNVSSEELLEPVSYEEEEQTGEAEISAVEKDIVSSYFEQSDAEELEENLEHIEHNLPPEIQEKLKGKSIGQRLEITTKYLENALDTMAETDPAAVDEAFLKQNKEKVEAFIKRYKPDKSTKGDLVSEVLDRHEEWKNALVVADWTGSMYRYGAQVLQWHIDNFEASGITYFTLFNDGDRKTIKRVGVTDGIYFEKADNIKRLVALYDLVQTKGGGGDMPENDIEAILKGMEEYPDHGEIILIADNNACVRDIELANLIEKPVRIILCGYNKVNGVNPDYLNLADITGGVNSHH